ncbi:hypothetical protein ASD21_07730 [Caulobacter sp. Root1455]|uniref:hypothetical protein n=1 Tax=Caulobacter sp. Root1455 TaxID=1736465 RepID=UPI0006F742D5|nr:hypothetical protein [Caulobacter sp. Root1455]KQY95245.1 hypothetical protein ASD21_07730 [Caulobacter sp. Root1455]
MPFKSIRKRLFLAAALGAIASPVLAAPPSADPGGRGQAYATVPPMNRTVETRLLPQMAVLLDKLMVEKRDMTLDGVRVFDADDKFLPGKVAIGLAYLLIDTPRDDPRFKTYLAGYRQIADMTVDDTNNTWGVYYYCQALHMLQEAGLLEQAVSPEILAKLKTKLDWRAFVRPDDLTLIDLPNNYYGVAFSVARLRHQLGWEDASASEALLERTLDHYRKYSGEYGFADETDGEGRFDRYSVLLIGEISHRLIEAGMPATPEVKGWLRKSVDLMLPRLNPRGEGFEYGRSIGTYGETAFLEVLTVAAKLDVLTPREKAMAYAFSSRVTARYMDFWFDPKMGSVNLWEHGRRTDEYRGKHRILGENLSLARQHIYTSAIWNELGFKDKAPDPGYAAWLDTLPKRRVTWFARGEHDRLVVTLRDRGRVIGLPIINGGKSQHENTPYYPIPFSPGMLAGVADGEFPQLLPRLTLADGSRLTPLAYARNVKVTEQGARTIVTYEQTQLDRLGASAPIADDRFSVRTTYVLAPGKISRTDVFTPKGGQPIKAVDLSFASFSSAPSTKGGATTYGQGDVRAFTVTGLSCKSRALEDEKAYRTPTGAFQSLVECAGGARTRSGPLTVSWSLSYQ